MTARRDKPNFASLLRRASVGREEPDTEPDHRTPVLETPRPRDEWAYEAMQFLVDPARVRIWSGNSRNYDELTAANCRDLIGSIVREGMQKVAAIVRPVFDDEQFEYEIISGTRRHFAVSYLRGTTMPDLRLLVQVEILDDEGAFRLADFENRARRDLTDVERAKSYAAALNRHYNGDVAAMAERLGLPKSSLERLIRIATLPDIVVAAFGAPGALSPDTAEELAERLDGPLAPVILATAGQIARAQSGRRDDNLPPYTGAEVMRLIDGVVDDVHPHALEQLTLNIDGASAERVTFTIDGGQPLEAEMLARIVKAMIDGAVAQGIAIRWARKP